MPWCFGAAMLELLTGITIPPTAAGNQVAASTLSAQSVSPLSLSPALWFSLDLSDSFSCSLSARACVGVCRMSSCGSSWSSRRRRWWTGRLRRCSSAPCCRPRHVPLSRTPLIFALHN